jgi:WD40 repeat protein
VDVATGREVLRCDGHSGLVSDAAFRPDGACFATASDDGTVRLWATVPDNAPLFVGALPSTLDHVEVTPDGRHVLTVASGVAWVHDATTGRRLAALPGREGHTVGSHLSPDGSRVAVITSDGVLVWDVAQQRTLYQLQGLGGLANAACFSPDGALLATAADDKTPRLWNAATGALVHKLVGHTDAVWDAEFSPDGTRLVTISNDRTARVWDTASGAPVAELRGHSRGLSDAAFSPDGRRVVTTAADGTARVWDAATGQPIATLEGHAIPPQHACFSPAPRQARGAVSLPNGDGARVLTCARDVTARVWDATTGKELLTLRGHTTGVYQARFSPDGTRIITAGGMAARVWDAATGRELIALGNHDNSVRDAAFLSDGLRAFSAGDDGVVRFAAVAPWRVSELPGDPSMAWEARFRLWHRQRYDDWLARTRPARP